MKWSAGDRALVTGDHALKGREVVVIAVKGGGAFVARPERPDAGYFVTRRQLVAPRSPVPAAAKKSEKRAPCRRCGYGNCQCLELMLILHLKGYGIDVTEANREYQFGAADGRKWSADFVWHEASLLVEVEGGTYRSRHREAAGYTADCEKYNYATLHGWKVLRYDTALVTSGRAAREIAQVLGVTVE